MEKDEILKKIAHAIKEDEDIIEKVEQCDAIQLFYNAETPEDSTYVTMFLVSVEDENINPIACISFDKNGLIDARNLFDETISKMK